MDSQSTMDNSQRPRWNGRNGDRGQALLTTVGAMGAADRLPPHSVEAEQGVLGCCLLEPETCMPKVAERFKGERCMYDLRHETILETLLTLWTDGVGIDLITVQTRLKDQGRGPGPQRGAPSGAATALEQVGGIQYLTELTSLVPSAANLETYLEIVWDKFLARKLIKDATETVGRIFEENGVSETLLARIKRQQEEFERTQSRSSIVPRYLKEPLVFEQPFYSQFFGDGAGTEPGLELPIDFKLKIRPDECTLITGDNGGGKSTWLSYFGIHLAAAGEKVCVASMEMPPAVTLWVMASQLLGTKWLPDSTEGHRRALDAFAWLQSRVMFYDFLGIADWRDVLDTFRFAAERNGQRVFIIDSVMKIGIPDDDYAQQGLAAAAFQSFAQQTHSHLFFVVHENKGDGRSKSRIRGSKQWADNANNIVRIERNEEKGEKQGKKRHLLEVERKQKNPNRTFIEELEADMDRMKKDWDAHIVLQKQRWPGSQQNAARVVWFDPESFQFRTHWEDPAVKWLDRWAGRRASGGQGHAPPDPTAAAPQQQELEGD